MNNFNITIAQESIDGNTIQTVNGRQIHAALEIGKDYSSWVKAQIDRTRLVEDKDFVKLTQRGELSATGQTRIDYHFTLEGCKHIAMISGTDKGFAVRDYFIDCEKRVLSSQFAVPTTLSGALRLAADQADVIELQLAQIAIAAPKVEAFNRISTTMQGSLCIRDAAKNLQVPEKQLKSFLFNNGWVYNREGIKGNANPLAFSNKLNSGLLEHKMSGSAAYTNTQVRVTAKGLTKLAVAFESM